MELNQAFLKIYEDKYHLQLDSVQRTLGVTIVYPEEENNYFENDLQLPVFILDSAMDGFHDDSQVVKVI